MHRTDQDRSNHSNLYSIALADYICKIYIRNILSNAYFVPNKHRTMDNNNLRLYRICIWAGHLEEEKIGECFEIVAILKLECTQTIREGVKNMDI